MDGAKFDEKLENSFQHISNLSCPDGLSYNYQISHNGNSNNDKYIHIINGQRRFNSQFHTVCITNSEICNERESKQINNTKIITAKHPRWWLKVPVEISKNKRVWIRMLGDSAADKPCANFEWACKHFRNQICKDNHPVTSETGGGIVKPEFCIWLSLSKKWYYV